MTEEERDTYIRQSIKVWKEAQHTLTGADILGETQTRFITEAERTYLHNADYLGYPEYHDKVEAGRCPAGPVTATINGGEGSGAAPTAFGVSWTLVNAALERCRKAPEERPMAKLPPDEREPYQSHHPTGALNIQLYYMAQGRREVVYGLAEFVERGTGGGVPGQEWLASQVRAYFHRIEAEPDRFWEARDRQETLRRGREAIDSGMDALADYCCDEAIGEDMYDPAEQAIEEQQAQG